MQSNCGAVGMKSILFVCTGNSARSIMAEAYMNHAGAGRWRAYSAGSSPTGAPNPLALATLDANGVPAQGGDGPPRSKSWDDFAAASAPPLDVVVTVCDNAAGEVCPVWPRKNGEKPTQHHWGFPDPAAATGDDGARRAAFEAVFQSIRRRIDDFLHESD